MLLGDQFDLMWISARCNHEMMLLVMRTNGHNAIESQCLDLSQFVLVFASDLKLCTIRHGL